jgi:4-diphosphocytidyl-2-C-methyl-D-erythritol kinase
VNPKLTVGCPAKLNLFLHVLARESSGMHGLETLLCRLELTDELEIERIDSGIELEVVGADVGPSEENLAWRAADAVLESTGRKFGVRMRLTKRIPAGAGLGGGSSDAAAALDAANQLAGNAIPRGELMQMAARLGSDVPFFLARTPLALAWGHGTRMVRFTGLPSRPILLVVPDVRVNTAEAYREIDTILGDAANRGAVAMDAAMLSNWGDVARMSGNSFEAAIFAKHPEIRAAYEALAATTPMLCRMTGSGSALFAVYRNERDRDDAASRLGGRHGALIATTNR